MGVNFPTHPVHNVSALQLKVNLQIDNATELVLDTSAGLSVHSAVLLRGDGGEQPLEFSFGEPHKVRACTCVRV